MAAPPSSSYLNLSCPETQDPPPSPTYYYYSGLLCGGSIMKYFRSTDPALSDHCNVIYGWCDTCGEGSNQCFDNISPVVSIGDPGYGNTNDIITCNESCAECAGVSLNFIGIKYRLIGSKFGINNSLEIYTNDNSNVVTNVTVDVTLSSGTYTLTIPNGSNTSDLTSIPYSATFTSMTITSPIGIYNYNPTTDYIFYVDTN